MTGGWQVFEFIPRLVECEEWAVDDSCSDTEEHNDTATSLTS